MSTDELFIYSGDTKTIDIPMVWEGEPFAPGGEWSLLLTAKANKMRRDDEALFQKSNIAGITVVDDSTARVQLVHVDTDGLATMQLALGIRAKHNISGSYRNVAEAKLEVIRPTSREAEASIPIYTTEPPVRGESIVFNRFDGHYYRLFFGLVAGDPSGVPTLQAELFSTTPVSAAAPICVDRLTNTERLIFIDQSYDPVTGVGDGVPVIQSEPIP